MRNYVRKKDPLLGQGRLAEVAKAEEAWHKMTVERVSAWGVGTSAAS